MKDNLLIIYKNSEIPNLKKLEASFKIIVIPKINKKIDFQNYKKYCNIVASKYNDIIFSTNSKFIFFVCSSELNQSIDGLLKFKLNNDFGYFTDNKTVNTIKFLSGAAIKTDILIKIGCFDKDIPHNLYLNFLINYSRFFPEKGLSIPPIKMNLFKSLKFFPLEYLENFIYTNQPLQKKYYLQINKHVIFNQKIIGFFIIKTMNFFFPQLKKFIKDNTFVEYW